MRGTGGHLIILEEAAFIKENFVKVVVDPILMLKFCSLVAITSPPTEIGMAYDYLASKKIYVELSISYCCAECQIIGVSGVCPHREYLVPPHINIGKIDAEDEDVQREILGVQTKQNTESGRMYCFEPNIVDACFSASYYEFNSFVPYIIVAIDPSAGTGIVNRNSSDFCIVSVAPGNVILGVDAISAKTHHPTFDVLHEHIRRLRKIPNCEAATLIFDIESNGSMMASVLAEECFKHKSIQMINDNKTKIGTVTTALLKEEAMVYTREVLMQTNVRLCKHWITSNPDPSNLIRKFIKQLKEYERIVIPSQHIDKPPTIIYSGKGIHKNKPDDIAFTFQRAIRRLKIYSS